MEQVLLTIRSEEFLNVFEALLLLLCGYAYPIFLFYLFWRGRLFRVPIRLIDLLIWSRDLSTSAAQVQKAYDLQIAQWSGFATALLTATLGFISAAAVEIWKSTPNKPISHGNDFYIVIALGVISTLAIYAVCQHRITRLRAQFTSLYTALALLS